MKAQTQAQPEVRIFDAANLHEPTDLASAPWLVHPGDDQAYANPDLDDSK